MSPHFYTPSVSRLFHCANSPVSIVDGASGRVLLEALDTCSLCFHFPRRKKNGVKGTLLALCCAILEKKGASEKDTNFLTPFNTSIL